MIKIFHGWYKKGIIGKKEVVLYLYEGNIEGVGAVSYNEELNEHRFNIEFEAIQSIGTDVVKGIKCLRVDYYNTKSLLANECIRVLFPNVENVRDVVEFISDVKDRYLEEQKVKLQQEKERKEQRILAQQRKDEESKAYYEECFNFHITANNNPYYELNREGLRFAGIYFDKEKNLNFVSIDGNKKQESNACIPYDKIHYYEKAGSIHYTTEINGKYSSFGGSITGTTISKTATALGGLLLGPMGMAAGALFSHKPMQVELPSSSFDIFSDTHKIDDRSVVLNYYSDAKQQLMDIELPADIYNFLQTYVPEKKYGIVLEVEKQNEIEKHKEVSNGIEEHSVKYIAKNDDMDEFEKKIKKLVIMRENGILSDEEFDSEKRRILSEL